MSGAEKAVKDLEQLATADPEALIDSIEELLPAATSQGAGVATGVNAGLATVITGLADPVLSKGNGSLTQGEGNKTAQSCLPAVLLGRIVPKQGLYPFDCTQAVPFPIVYTFVDLQASKVPLLVALQQARKLFDAAQDFALLQHGPVNTVNTGFQYADPAVRQW